MAEQVNVLENEFWQAGILPATGASIAFGRIRRGNGWVDVMRPTPEADYGNSSKTASFIMLPWCNRIREGKLRFQGQTYQLKTAPDDGTARHGDIRNRAWQVEAVSETALEMRFESAQHDGVNFAFQFSAQAEYRLEGQDFIWGLTLRNEDTRPMPGGFGYHPYFARPVDVAQVMIPCNQQFNLVDYMAVEPPVPITPRVDFRKLRPLGEGELNDLLTGRQGDDPVRMVLPDCELLMSSSDVFEHILIFAPQGKPFFAVEPMSNASDGFNLYDQGLAGSGVFVLQPGEAISGQVRLRVQPKA
jgi:aldose 1-epimerase